MVALPLYRQEALLQEMGVEISRDSMARWILMAHEQLTPLLELFKNFLVAQSALHSGESPVQVLQENGKTLSGEFLERIKELFLLEREAKTLEPHAKLALLQQKHKPLLDALKERLDTEIPKVTPKSKLGLALGYMSREWEALTVFLTQPQVQISNNHLENFIRPFAVGRKTWLFSCSPAGAQASAALYSLLLSARANGLEARSYLISLFTELPLLQKTTPSAVLTNEIGHPFDTAESLDRLPQRQTH